MLPKYYLHQHPNFKDLLYIVGDRESIDPALVEKDYWIMHCLYGLQENGFKFELKGGTSLSKGYGILDRFSEDIDIQIHPPECMRVVIGHNKVKQTHCESRKSFYEWLSKNIKIDGISDIKRDTVFDDVKYRSGGIRLYYGNSYILPMGIKEGILLEVGFDNVVPNEPKHISSWVYEYATNENADIIDNRAKNIACYHPGYTLVEKLQAISTKYRQQQEQGILPQNFIRHYYDIYCLLQLPIVLDFVGSSTYHDYKNSRFRKRDMNNLLENDAFLLADYKVRQLYRETYSSLSGLFYKDQPGFDKIMIKIQQHIHEL